MKECARSRRDFLQTIGKGMMAIPLSCTSWKRSGHLPHIVMFLSDDHGLDFCGCYGNEVIHTPNLDSLAEQGVRFTNMYAASPTCAPSRSVLFTGLYPARNGAMGNHTTCKEGIGSLPGYLSQLGYRVVLANKVHVKPESVFNFESFQATLPKNPNQLRIFRSEGLDTKAVDQFLAEHVQKRYNQPLCLILADDNPHVVWEQNKTYDPDKLPIPPNMVDTPKTRNALANYYQDITTMDKHLGDVLNSLKKYGYEDNTLFIYTSDQGPEWPHCKWTVYDTGIRVPFIAHWPRRVKAGSVCDALVSFVDMTPTFIDIAGGKQPEDLDGQSFKEVLLGKRKSFRDKIFATHTGDGTMNVFPQRGVRTKQYKYILNLKPENTWTTHFTKVSGIPDSHKEVWDSWVEKALINADAARLIDIIQHHPSEELFDTFADPYELYNLVSEPRMEVILGQLRTDLRQWMEAQGDTQG